MPMHFSVLKVFTYTASLGLNLSTPNTHACMHTHTRVHTPYERLTSHPLGLRLYVTLSISEAQLDHFLLYVD